MRTILQHRCRFAAVGLLLCGGVGMALTAWPGIALSCDLMADPNYPHALFGVHLARGGMYENVFYPGVVHFLTYAVFIRLWGSTSEPFSFDELQNAVLLCRIASLSLNVVVYWAAGGGLMWLSNQFKPCSSAARLGILAAFTVLWVIAFPINYYSYYLRPDNSLMLGLLAAVVACVTLWRVIGQGAMRAVIHSGMWLGAATALLTITKNQGQPFMAAAVIVGFAAGAYARRGKEVWIWLATGLASHFLFASLVWLALLAATQTPNLPWAAFVDPTYVLRKYPGIVSVSAERFLRSEIWTLGCAAPAFAVLIALWNFRCFRLWNSRTRESWAETAGIGGLLLFLLILPMFYGLRLLAVYNLVLPVAAAIFLAACATAFFWPRASILERQTIGFAALTAIPIACLANHELRTRALNEHQLILSVRGSLDQAQYISDDQHWCDLPEMRESLQAHAEITHWRAWIATIGDVDYLRPLTDALKADPNYQAAAEGRYDFREPFPSGASARRRLAVLLGFRSPPRPAALSADCESLGPGRYRLKFGEDERPFIIRAVFTPSKSEHPQTLISDWTNAAMGQSMYLAVRPDGNLRLGDGRDAIRSVKPLRWDAENRLQIEYDRDRCRVFLNDALVRDDSAIPRFSASRPFVIGAQGELTSESFRGPLSVQVQGAEIEAWR